MRPVAVTALYVTLRLGMIIACTVGVGTAAALIGEALLPAPLSDWGFFGRAGFAFVCGGVAGLLLGLAVAIRLGRRRWDGPARVGQTLAALAIPALLLLGQCMEG